MDQVKSSTQLAGVADLALLAPVKPGVVPGAEGFTHAQRLQLLLRTVNAIRAASRETPLFDSPFPDSVGRFGLLHAFRYALVPPEIGSQGEVPAAPGQMRPGVFRLFLSVTFDGGWEPYLRVVYRDLGPLLDTIFANCSDYRSSWAHPYDDYIRWVRRQEAPAGIFYAESPMTVIDQRYLRQVERLQLVTADPAQARTDIAAHAEPAPRDMAAVMATVDKLGRDERIEMSTNHLRALKGLYDLRACHPANADGDDRTLLRFAQRAMPEFREALARGKLGVPPDNRASVDWLLSDAERPDYPVDDRQPALPRPRSAFQAGIVAPADGATHGALFLLAVTDAAAARRWLAILPVTPGDEEPLKTGGLLRQLAFTRQGLQALQAVAGDAQLALFPQEFIDGMEARAGLLGDVRGNHPDRWRRPLHQGREVELRSVHLVLQVRLADPLTPGAGLHQRLQQVQDDLAATPGLLLLATEALRSWPQDGGHVREHFGFRDGLSQPQLPGAPTAPDPVWDDQIQPGDLLLGHPTGRGGGVTPRHPDPLRDNGSFLVLRKTAQHVDRWHRVVQATALAIAPDLAQRPPDEQQALQALAAAKLMGRTAEGAPVGQPTLGPVNRFNYDADAKGMGCPFAAHARRTNPRGRNEHGQRPVPRLLRRGMSYGLRWTEGETADTERGLFFMAYCGSIAEQFEVVQRWVAGGNSSGVASSHGDPLLAVPQAGQPRWFQWLHDDNQVRRVSLGDEALTTLRWGLYLFVPAMAGLRHIARGPAVAPAPTPQPLAGALYAPGTPAFEDWRQLLQDADQRDTLWRRVRDSDGQVQTPYGLLVADADKALAILRDRGRRYTVRGYGRRFKNSVGPGYLGMDAVGPHAGHDEQAERSGINAAIVAIDEATAYEAAFRHTQARLDQLEADTPLLGTAKLMAVDLPDLGEQVLARLCTEWFGVPDGTHLKTGGTASADPPPRCPRDLVDVARHIFGAHPSPAVSAEGQRRGQALQAAVLAYLQSHAATLPEPLPRLSRAIWQGLHPQGLKVVADTIGGVMLGFTPSVFGNYSTLMRAWVDRGTDGARTLWDLQALLLQGGATPAPGYDGVRQRLRPALIEQMRRCPIPTTVWRERAGTDVPDDPTGVHEPGKIVIGLHGVMQDPAAPDLMMWGGAWRGDTAHRALHTVHACPGYGLSTGVLLGLLAGLLLAGSLSVSPSPSIIYWRR
jgi:Dyp-type peroxidase family